MLLNHKKLTQLITLVSLMGILGTLGFSFVGVFKDVADRPTNTAAKSGEATKQLKLQESGYMEVLKREPKNETALQGLVQIRLAAQDFKGALAPLDTLIQLHPKEDSLKKLRAQVQLEAKK